MLDLVLPIEGKKLFSAHDLVLMDPTLKAEQKKQAVEDDGDKRTENKCQQDKDCEAGLAKKFEMVIQRLMFRKPSAISVSFYKCIVLRKVVAASKDPHIVKVK